MLVLDRKEGQQILIGNGVIKIKVIKLAGDVIRIGIHAPTDMIIDREEIYLKKLREQNAKELAA